MIWLYVIKNNREVYIRLDQNGRAITCSKKFAMQFEKSKAENIITGLPKPLRNMHFKAVFVSEIIPDKKKECKKQDCHEEQKKEEDKKERKVLETKNYEVSENILRWVDKFGTFNETIEEANARKTELYSNLSLLDKELIDLLHIIEMESPKDLYKGWQLYKKLRDNRSKRRSVKDEISILENVLYYGYEFNKYDRKRLQKFVNGLSKRKYTFRVVEESEDENVL